MNKGWTLIGAGLLVAGLAVDGLAAAECPGRPERVAADAEAVCPVLVGQQIPDVEVRRVDASAASLSGILAGRPGLVIFYRGGWCPFCNAQLGQLQAVESELRALGFAILAISPDRPGKIAAGQAKQEVTYDLLSDSDMEAARAFGVAFQVDEATVARYKADFGIDLEADSGRTHHQLPVPSAFVVDAGGKIVFAYVNPDYKVRVAPELVLAAARAAIAPTSPAAAQ